MEKRIYRYRGGGIGFLIGFLLLWSTGWWLGIGSAVIAGHIKVNGRDQSIQAASGVLLAMAGAGTVVLSIAVRLLLGYLNDRIELAGSELSWFNWTGRLFGKADLVEMKAVSDPALFGSISRTRVRTERGEFSIGKSLDGYFDLRERITRAIRGEILSAGEALPPGRFSATPPVVAKRYSYRFSILHLFSFLWLGGILSILVLGAKGSWNRGGFFLFAIILSCFAAIGVWMQLKGWVERLELGPDGLVWTDLRGKVRVSAPLAEILGVYEVGTNGSLLKIETTQGTIQVMSYLWGYRDLKRQVLAILAAKV